MSRLLLPPHTSSRVPTELLQGVGFLLPKWLSLIWLGLPLSPEHRRSLSAPLQLVHQCGGLGPLRIPRDQCGQRQQGCAVVGLLISGEGLPEMPVGVGPGPSRGGPAEALTPTQVDTLLALAFLTSAGGARLHWLLPGCQCQKLPRLDVASLLCSLRVWPLPSIACSSQPHLFASHTLQSALSLVVPR